MADTVLYTDDMIPIVGSQQNFNQNPIPKSHEFISNHFQQMIYGAENISMKRF